MSGNVIKKAWMVSKSGYFTEYHVLHAQGISLLPNVLLISAIRQEGLEEDVNTLIRDKTGQDVYD